VKKEIFKCPKCGYEIRASIQKHINYCDGRGPRRIHRITDPRKRGGNQKGISYEERYGLEKSLEIRKKLSKPSKGGRAATPEKEIERKEKIRNAINLRYSKGWENIAGRCKKYDYFSPIAGQIKVDGTWELKTCAFLDNLKINWRRNTKRFFYFDENNKRRSYKPDFYLVDENLYIEVKGFTTDLDRLKWSQFTEKLEIWDSKVLKDKKILGE
jgi:hypothetical protein